jgi:hypothetical protein
MFVTAGLFAVSSAKRPFGAGPTAFAGQFCSSAHARKHEYRRHFSGLSPSHQAMPHEGFSIHSLPFEALALTP